MREPSFQLMFVSILAVGSYFKATWFFLAFHCVCRLSVHSGTAYWQRLQRVLYILNFLL